METFISKIKELSAEYDRNKEIPTFFLGNKCLEELFLILMNQR